jgi:hypothetical protein
MRLTALVLLGGFFIAASVYAEDAEHAALRLANAAGDAAEASNKTSDPVLRHELVEQQFACMLVSCQLMLETPLGTDPKTMAGCADMQARFKKHFDESDQLDIENMMAHLRISTMK